MQTYYINEQGKLIAPVLIDTDHTDYVLINGELAVLDEVNNALIFEET